ncbi:MAG: response regulator transcription factor [Coriobacteriia bacterium]|nr:response regulator transcription factor [Coriobacteriia bacterium]
MTDAKKILIVEDDVSIAEIERDFLEINGYVVTLCADGREGYELALSNQFDLVILDLMLPGMSGYEICRGIRGKTPVPIIMVTARSEDADKIRGLGLGADDYISKPFSPTELVARVKAHLAQYERLTAGAGVGVGSGAGADAGAVPAAGAEAWAAGAEAAAGVLAAADTGARGGARVAWAGAAEELSIGNIRVDRRTQRVYVSGQEVECKHKEYELLVFLMSNPDAVFSKERLYERIWGMDALGDLKTVAVHVNRLREKIERDPQTPEHIQTVWGAGYRFRV